jgi:hypothetical protein
MKKISGLLILIIVLVLNVQSQALVRREINIPDISGYKTLKCDFHIHTVFSNGLVWPTIRIQEAWMEGLDVIAFTDHLEYHTFDKDVVYNDNRAIEVAQPMADMYNIILIRGVEITRKQPLGHFNAIFTTDNNALRVPDSLKSIAIANQQNAFVFWNHPLEENGNWFDVQEQLYKQGQLKGIEVANHNTYFPEAQQWCMDKNLTMMSNSDVHNPITFDYDFSKGEHRPTTLVFAKEKSPEGIKEALINHRTVVYWKDKLIGREEFLKAIYKESVLILNTSFSFKKDKKNKAVILIKNNSEIPYQLVFKNDSKNLNLPNNVTLAGSKTTAIAIEYTSSEAGVKTLLIPFEISNLLVLPNQGMHSEINLNINLE